MSGPVFDEPLEPDPRQTRVSIGLMIAGTVFIIAVLALGITVLAVDGYSQQCADASEHDQCVRKLIRN